MGSYPSIDQQSFLFLLFYAVYIMVMTVYNLFDQYLCNIYIGFRMMEKTPGKMTVWNLA